MAIGNLEFNSLWPDVIRQTLSTLYLSSIGSTLSLPSKNASLKYLIKVIRMSNSKRILKTSYRKYYLEDLQIHVIWQSV